MDTTKQLKMQGSTDVKNITRNYAKVKLEGRGIIAPTAPPTPVGEDPLPLIPAPMDGSGLPVKTAATGSNFFLLAALGVGAWFYFNRK